MSEIKKYKKYLNFKANPRYLRRDFMVPLYTGTEPDIVPEASIEQQGAVQELNDGGRVSFKKGGKVIEKEYLINFMKENSGISHLEKAKKLNKLGFKNSQGGKITDSLLEKFVTQNPELKGLGARSAAFTLDEVKQYARPKQLQDFESGLIDEQTFRTRVNQYRGDLKKTPEQKELYRKINYERMKIDPEKKARVRERQLMYNEKRYLEKGMYPPSKNPKDALWRDLLRSADVDDRVSLVGKRPNKYPRDVFQSIKLKDNETGKIISYKNLEKHPEYNKAIEPYQTKFAINQSELSPETRKKITYQRAEGGNKYNIVIQHNQGLGKNPFNTSLAIQGENIQESLIKNRFQKRFDAAETLSDKKQAINIFKKELEKKAPNIISQPGKKTYGVETDVEDLLKTSKVPIKDRRKILQVIKEKRTQAIANIGCYTLNKSLGGRVNFSEGSNCYAKGLEKIKSGNLTPGERIIAGDFLKEVGADTKLVSSLTKGGKNALRLLQDFTVGVGRGGVLLTAGLSVPFALAEAAEGASTQRMIGAATDIIPGLGPIIGTTRESELRKKVGPELEPYLKNEQNQLRYNEIEDEIKRLEQNIQDNLLSGEVQPFGYQQERINKLKEEEKQIEKDLLSYEENPNVIKKVNDFAKEEKLRLEIADLKKFGQPIDSITVEEKDPKTEKEIQKKQIDLETLEKDVFSKDEPYEENIEQRQTIEEMGAREGAAEGGYIDYIRDFNRYASGGRIHLGKGGGGPKLSRRGFLGFLAGAAASPFVIKAMKGKKLLSGAKVATKVLPKVSGMPDWFNPLVTKIMNEGIDISPKATRVEDIVKVKKLEVIVPGEPKPDIITMSEYPDGRIEISADVYGGSFDSPFDLVYKPPKSDIDLATGKAINEPGEFSVMENRPRPVYSPDDADYEIDYEKMNVEDAVSDLERIEKIATGKRIPPQRVQKREKARAFVEENPYDDIVNRYGDAGDIEYDRMRDEGLLDEIE
jgi:hypothetical protein